MIHDTEDNSYNHHERNNTSETVPLSVPDKHIIYVDDAGHGSLCGGIVIGFRAEHEGMLWHEYIPETFFQEPLKSRRGWKIILKKIFHLIQTALREIPATQDTHAIYICRGWVFSYAIQKLREEGWHVKPIQIIGVLQNYVENMFKRELAKIDPYLTECAIPGSTSFFRQLQWVGENLSEREQYVKSGWRSWKKKWKPRLMMKKK